MGSNRKFLRTSARKALKIGPSRPDSLPVSSSPRYLFLFAAKNSAEATPRPKKYHIRWALENFIQHSLLASGDIQLEGSSLLKILETSTYVEHDLIRDFVLQELASRDLQIMCTEETANKLGPLLPSHAIDYDDDFDTPYDPSLDETEDLEREEHWH